MRKLLFLAMAGFVAWLLYRPQPAIELGPGIRAPDSPRQALLDSPNHLQRDGYRITKLAEFALGWGRMSDEQVLTHIDISQGGRWYRWRTAQFPIPRREIETHSANMHMIPADEAIAAELDRVRQGQLVALRGFLVRVDADDGWRWQSSLSRDDTGANACELVYVERFRILD